MFDLKTKFSESTLIEYMAVKKENGEWDLGTERGETLKAPEDKKNFLKSKNNVLFGSCKSRNQIKEGLTD